jgi:bifunctional non-homologous end joining protein LigD
MKMDFRITHPEKVLYPRDGYTKADVVGYYVEIADAMLPYMRDHPVALLRFNDGLDGERFFHKRTPKYFPDYIDRVQLTISDEKVNYSVINNVEALAYVANHNSIELHLLTVRSDDLWHPDRMVFDLDPSIEDFEQVREATRWLRELLDELGLAGFVMTSGSRGLHTWVPLNRKSDVDEAHAFANDVARVLVERHPETLTTEFSKADRGEKIYVDVARNAPGQHAVAPYSLRARDGAPVAMPITWDELEDPKVTPQRWNIKSASQRLGSDPWKGMSKKAKSLATARKKLDRLLPGSD